MPRPDPFTDKVAFITGAASGIGRAAAVAFAAEGARLAILDRTEDALADTAAAVEPAGGEVLVIGCDVSDPDQVEAAVARTVERFGKPEEIAEAVLWMASDLGGFVTGAGTVVDGGWSL